ncbi:MAG: hypothetical protein AAGG09_08325 [Pseudomonadota bacterium]
MALIRFALAALLLATPAFAQTPERPNRPSFLQGMGLLELQEIEIRRDGAPYIALSLPQGGGVQAYPRDTSDASDNVIAAWDFATDEGQFIESLTLTTAEVDLADPEVRRFALANMLMLRSLPQLTAQFPSARVLGFGPLPHNGGLDMVQMVGTFAVPDTNRGILFRHIGVLQPDTTRVLVAIVNIDTGVFPVRNEDDVVDTFAGRSLATLRFTDADAQDDPEAGADGDAEKATE